MQITTINLETHEYADGLPSVTTIIKGAGLMAGRHIMEEERRADDSILYEQMNTADYLLRGSYVHLACEYYDKGILDWSSLDPRIVGYVKAYADWRQVQAGEFDWIEIPMKEKSGKYAGTGDRILAKRPRQLWDIKTGAPQRWHKIQSAAYVNMLEDPFSYSRYCLYVRKDGTWKIDHHPKSEYLQDLAVFQSALNIFNWKKEA
jgi:hypothetical protein